MQKRYTLLLPGFLLLLMLACSTPSFALESSQSARPQKQFVNPRSMLQPTIQEERKQVKATVAKEKEAFKQKLQEIRDVHKKQIVERIDTRLPQINERSTTRMQHALTEMATRVTTMKETAKKLSDQGADVTAIDAAIATADAAVSSASAAVTEQMAKEYTLTITTEENLRLTIGPVVKQMTTDLKATYASVVAAHLAVVKAESMLKPLSHTTLPTGTTTATDAAK